MYINSDIIELYIKTTKDGEKKLNDAVEGIIPFKILFEDIKKTLKILQEEKD